MKRKEKIESFIHFSLFFSRFACGLTTHFFSQKDSVVFQAGALAFCSVPVCSVSGVLVSYCCFPRVVFLCLVFGCVRCYVDFPSVLFCFLLFNVVFHCCFSLLVGFRCCFSLLFFVCFLSEMCCVSQALFVKMLKTV